MFKLKTTSNITVSSDIITLIIVVGLIFVVYFFSYHLQQILAKVLGTLSKKIGTFAADRDYQLQRYIYQHNKSPITMLYNWVNTQLIASFITHMGVAFTFIFWVLCFILMLMLTRIIVSERIERREADVMNAMDLIIPEAKNGIKNAIATYIDNFAPSIRDDFKAFLMNVNERGYSFEDAMYMLNDNLGIVFRDFAQKSIYFERIGEKEMLEIFSDITETNRLRRQLRDENSNKFITLKADFLVSVALTFGYFIFIVVTDDFSRNFFLLQTGGKVLLVIIAMIVFLVMGYITTIKSRAI